MQRVRRNKIDCFISNVINLSDLTTVKKRGCIQLCILAFFDCGAEIV